MKYRGSILAGIPALMMAVSGPVNAETSDLPVATELAAQPDVASASNTPPYRVKLTAPQLLAHVEQLIADHDFTAAAPLVEALGQAPGFELQQRFLRGYIAVETGDLKGAEVAFRAILRDHPKQTRVRLELARLMVLQGKEGSADYHFRLAQQDPDVPEDIAKTIRSTRSILRDSRNWRLNFDVGLAPDTNINSATSAETVNINFGPFQLPLTLDQSARQKSGIGQTGGISSGIRVKATNKIALLIDGDGRFVNYEGKFADDIQIQLSAGPEFRLGETSSVSVQALGEQRWFGGKRASRDFGARIGFQKVLNAGQRIGVSLDARQTNSGFSDSYSGRIIGGNLTYEHVIGRSFIASASVFGRLDDLESKAFSNKAFGLSAGLGGELPLGINAGLNASISRAIFDAPQQIYSDENREDLRLYGRAYLGMRALRLAGFSPSVEYVYSQVDSNYTLYESDRHRFNFKLSRYF